MKVAIVVYCLRGGGAERVSSYLANGLSQGGDKVSLITELGPEHDQYVLCSGIARHTIGQQGGSRAGRIARMVRKIIRLRSVLRRERPDVVVSFMTRGNNLALIASLGMRHRTVISERNDPRSNFERSGDSTLRKLLYPRADLMVAQTPAMATVTKELFGITNVVIIPNPAVIPAHVTRAKIDVGTPYILAMGRLASQKGFDVLIRAYAQSVARHTHRLLIAGQGGGLARYTDIARDEVVADRVTFLGHVDDPMPLLAGCAMFILSSRYEGFPNVLLEAMGLARPVISTILPSGAHDMIADGENGLLVPVEDAPALAKAIDRLARDPIAAEAIGARAPLAVDRFRLPVVIDLWRSTLHQLVGSQA